MYVHVILENYWRGALTQYYYVIILIVKLHLFVFVFDVIILTIKGCITGQPNLDLKILKGLFTRAN